MCSCFSPSSYILYLMFDFEASFLVWWLKYDYNFTIFMIPFSSSILFYSPFSILTLAHIYIYYLLSTVCTRSIIAYSLYSPWELRIKSHTQHTANSQSTYSVRITNKLFKITVFCFLSMWKKTKLGKNKNIVLVIFYSF